MATLITAYEVVKYSPVRFDYPTATICTAIKNKELSLFRDCLGTDFYNLLLADVINYHNIPEYNIYTEYTTGDIVFYDGTLFVALQGAPPSTPLEDDSSWAIAPKFTTTKYQVLWDDYLKYYLAYMIIHSTINYSTFQAGSMGLVLIKNYTEQGQSTVGLKELWNWKSNIKQDAVDFLENMKAYITDHIEDYPTLAGVCGLTCGIRKKRRIAFRL